MLYCRFEHSISCPRTGVGYMVLSFFTGAVMTPYDAEELKCAMISAVMPVDLDMQKTRKAVKW